MSVIDKINKLKVEGRCNLYFRRYHSWRFCRAKIKPCELCNSKRHTSKICEKLGNTETKESKPQHSVSSLCEISMGESKRILFQTCSAKINQHPKARIVRCLLDSGSERTFLTKDLAKELKLPVIRKEKLSVYSFASRDPDVKIYDVVNVELENISDSRKIIKIEALVTDIISSAL